MALAAAALVALGAYAAHQVFVTQCFTHHVPEFPNHGLSAVREAAPVGLDAADALLKLHLQHGERGCDQGDRIYCLSNGKRRQREWTKSCNYKRAPFRLHCFVHNSRNIIEY